jgi:hypothetical protein
LWDDRSALPHAWHLTERVEDRFAVLLRQAHHLVGTSGPTTDAKTGVASGNQPAADGMEDLIERGIADACRPGMLNEWQGEPLSHDWQVPGSEELKANLRHIRNVLRDTRWVVIGARTVRPCNENHEWAQDQTVLSGDA